MNKDIKSRVEMIKNGGITSPKGYIATGVYCGIKKDNGAKKDLALIVSQKDAVAAGVFTRNLFKAAPVLLSSERIVNPIRAIVVNSGNANACTGDTGMKDAKKMGDKVAEVLNISPDSVLVSSTGVIGVNLPMENIEEGVTLASGSLKGGQEGNDDAAVAILTTDTVIKKVACKVMVRGGEYTIGGIAKGSGMICPNMATMLAFVTTDLNLERNLLQKALTDVVNRTFNMITVDGDTSTNDMVLVLANGASGVRIQDDESEGYTLFREALMQVCRELAYQVINDGEGVTKVITLELKGLPNFNTGQVLAHSILNSLLVKTAFFGEDANWGRVFTAMGYSGASFDPHKVDLWLGGVQVASEGKGLPFSEEKALEVLKKREITITVDLHQGDEEVTAWGSDLSHEYVNINSDYRS